MTDRHPADPAGPPAPAAAPAAPDSAAPANLDPTAFDPAAFDPAAFDPAEFESATGFDPDDFEPADDGAPTGPLPVVAVVGRPNVGKSTLVNRIIGRRQAVVEDVPGVTRDRVAYDATWAGRAFTVVDTGGWEPDARDRAAAIAAQAEAAVATADVVLFVVDAVVGSTDVDEAAVRMLRRSAKPVLLIANKVDNTALEAEAANLWGLGLGEPWPISALHGRGSGDLLDALLAAFPEPAPPEAPGPRGPRRVALVGRPNVGKSSLLNRLAREERAVVDAVAGTTVDPVDSLVAIGGETWQLVDTAGLRKRVGRASGTEYYASLRTAAAIEAAEVAVVLLDAGEPISEQDQRILSMVEDAGRAMVIAFNKWDLVDADRRYHLDREIDRELRRLTWPLRVNISARTGRAVDRLAPALRTALASWEQRIPTGVLNQWLTALVQATPHPVRGGRAPRVLFATQAGTRPPKFVLFTTAPIDAGYQRFVARKLREEFGFTGSPIEVSVRAKKSVGPGGRGRAHG
ncbi:GTPase Der [Pilimelia anulata]|uniref:GTPase Der n=1 Tax=Pilimelia anulata TaxID=53371 RepID=A0A8J3FCB7_9ACTN|nr:ribosome biogenesis GTPase Der [Pilimelia anulata]GGK07923.1 GTPase Der [Pilimelia anulata]